MFAEAKSKLKLIDMDKAFIAYDHANKVPYLSQKQSEDFKVHFKNGLIYNAFGELYHDDFKQSNFVVDKDGQFFLANEDEFENLKHSSFLSGKAVAGAGEMIVKQGRLILLSNFSGHYLPNLEIARQVEKLLSASQIIPEFEQTLIQKNYLIDIVELSEMDLALKYKYQIKQSRQEIAWVKMNLNRENKSINEIPLPHPYCRRIFLR